MSGRTIGLTRLPADDRGSVGYSGPRRWPTEEKPMPAKLPALTGRLVVEKEFATDPTPVADVNDDEGRSVVLFTLRDG